MSMLTFRQIKMKARIKGTQTKKSARRIEFLRKRFGANLRPIGREFTGVAIDNLDYDLLDTVAVKYGKLQCIFAGYKFYSFSYAWEGEDVQKPPAPTVRNLLNGAFAETVMSNPFGKSDCVYAMRVGDSNEHA